MAGRAAATLQLAVWTAGLLVVARLLVTAGGGTLSVPLTSPGDLVAWSSETPPPDMAMALLRLAALAATGYLVAVTALAVVARLVRAGRFVATVERVTPAVVRRLAAGGSGIGLALGAAVGTLPSPGLVATPERPTVAAAPAHAPAPVDATMTRLPVATATMTRLAEPTPPPPSPPPPAPAQPSPTATMTRLDPTHPGAPRPDTLPGDTLPEVTPPEVASTEVTHTAVAMPAIDPASWVVEPGDSLWSIAAEVVAPPGTPAPAERVVRRYWQRLVEANRSHLVDSGNADLLVPGQRLTVPPHEP